MIDQASKSKPYYGLQEHLYHPHFTQLLIGLYGIGLPILLLPIYYSLDAQEHAQVSFS